MNFRAMVLLLAVSAAMPEMRYFRYERPVAGAGSRAGQTCVALDGGIFAHAAPGMTDVRLYRGTSPENQETPFVIREAAPVEQKQREIAGYIVPITGPPVRDGLANAQADLFPQMAEMRKNFVRPPIDQMKFFELIQIIPTPTMRLLLLGA